MASRPEVGRDGVRAMAFGSPPFGQLHAMLLGHLEVQAAWVEEWPRPLSCKTSCPERFPISFFYRKYAAAADAWPGCARVLADLWREPRWAWPLHGSMLQAGEGSELAPLTSTAKRTRPCRFWAQRAAPGRRCPDPHQRPIGTGVLFAEAMGRGAARQLDRSGLNRDGKQSRPVLVDAAGRPRLQRPARQSRRFRAAATAGEMLRPRELDR